MHNAFPATNHVGEDALPTVTGPTRLEVDDGDYWGHQALWNEGDRRQEVFYHKMPTSAGHSESRACITIWAMDCLDIEYQVAVVSASTCGNDFELEVTLFSAESKTDGYLTQELNINSLALQQPRGANNRNLPSGITSNTSNHSDESITVQITGIPKVEAAGWWSQAVQQALDHAKGRHVRPLHTYAKEKNFERESMQDTS